MKVLHTADWHLGKVLNGFSRLEEQREVLQEICEIAERELVDMVVIAGDIFDSYTPSNEAEEILYHNLKRLSRGGACPVVVIAGNHDSPNGLVTTEPLARACGIITLNFPNSLISINKHESHEFSVSKTDEGFIEISLAQYDYPIRLILTPYANEARMKASIPNEETELIALLQDKWTDLSSTYCDDKGVNMLFAHLFFSKKGEPVEEEPEGEKTINFVGGAPPIPSHIIPSQIQYVGLGHLHRPFQVDDTPCPVVYSGSPIAYSFGESNQTKSVSIVEAEPNKPVVDRRVELCKGKKLLRHESDDMNEAIAWLEQNQDALVELTMVSDTYIKASEERLLREIHPNIVYLIPKITKEENVKQQHQLDLSQSVESLFIDYFKSRQGQEPSAELINLFREIQSS